MCVTGFAGTGKSVIATTASSLLNREEVAVVNASGVEDKMLLVNMDVRRDSVTLPDSIPTLYVGNEVPKSRGDGSDLIIFAFLYKVARADPNLLASVRTEIPALIVKATRAYRSVALAHGDKNLWTLGGFPRYFHDNRERASRDD